MRKTLSKLLLGLFTLLALSPLAQAASVNSSVGVQSYMRYENGAIIPMNSSYDFGTATKSWDEGYFTTIHAGTLAISGVVTGTLDLDGNTFILDADGDTSLDAAVDDKVDITFPSGVGQFQIGDGTYSWVGTPVFGVEGDQELTGDLRLNAGGTVSTSSNGNLSLVPNGTGYTLIGDAGAASFGTPTNDDLYVSGRLELDGSLNSDGGIRMASNTLLSLGTSNETRVEYDLTSTPDTVQWYLPNSSLGIVFTDIDYLNKDHDHPLQSNPTIFVQDDTDPDVTNNKWISFSHNGTGGTITTGANTGAGSSPATIDNSIIFQPRGTAQMTITGVGGIVYTPTATQNITAAGGIGTTVFARIIRVQGSGGAVDITATLQIAAGTDGQMITLEGRSDTNTLKFDDGNGLQLSGGTSFTMGKGDMLTLIYDSTDAFWYETSRSDN